MPGGIVTRTRLMISRSVTHVGLSGKLGTLKSVTAATGSSVLTSPWCTEPVALTRSSNVFATIALE